MRPKKLRMPAITLLTCLYCIELALLLLALAY